MKQYSVSASCLTVAEDIVNYPIGHQEYKDYTQAHQAMKDVTKDIG